MWLDKYTALSALDRERFSTLINELLNRNFVLAYHYDNKNRTRRPNSNYNFIVRNFDVFEAYFDLADYALSRDDDMHVIALTNRLGYNHLHINKFTTLFLFTLRLMYDETKEIASTSEVVYTSTAQVVMKMIDLNLIPKRPRVADTVEVLRFALNHNIITRIDKTIDNFEAQLVILPTILLVISNEKVNQIYQVMFDKKEEGVEA